MKKTCSLIGLISVVLIVGLAMISCGGGGSPESVVKEFHSALEKGNTNKMLELSTPESAEMVNMLAGMMEEDKFKGALEEQGKIQSTEVVDISDAAATVNVTYSSGENHNFDLKKINGKWKINVNYK